MGWLLLTCFLVGLAILISFTEEGRGCLAILFSIAFGIIFITLIGAAALAGLAYLLVLALGG